MRVKLTIEITEGEIRTICEGEEKYCAVFKGAVNFILGLINYAIAIFEQYATQILGQAKQIGEELNK